MKGGKKSLIDHDLMHPVLRAAFILLLSYLSLRTLSGSGHVIVCWHAEESFRPVLQILHKYHTTERDRRLFTKNDELNRGWSKAQRETRSLRGSQDLAVVTQTGAINHL